MENEIEAIIKKMSINSNFRRILTDHAETGQNHCHELIITWAQGLILIYNLKNYSPEQLLKDISAALRQKSEQNEISRNQTFR